MRKLTILKYHSIDNSGSAVSISPVLFSQHLRYLKEKHFTVITLSEGLKLLTGHEPLFKKVVLTFDDGYENFHSRAFPLLSQYHFPATVFVVARYVGRENSWQKKNRVPAQRLMNWSQVEKLSHSGIEFGSKSLTHRDLTRISIDEVREEVEESRRMIEEHVGKGVHIFAYPFGLHNANVRETVRKHYDAAVGTNLAEASDKEDPYDLSRVDVHYIAHHFELLGKAIATPYLAIRN
ncbi:polysaccharide deacetylase family protein, partial [bacterium]|nr:polysaccharide deacetylase family protein [bacterium]